MRCVRRLPLPPDQSEELTARRERLLGCQPGQERVDTEWNQLYGSELRKVMLTVLEEQHECRCVYCETPGCATTIEHYYPKKQFPYHTFEWDNLSLACGACQLYKGQPLQFHGVWPLVIDPLNESVEAFLYISPYDGRIMPALGLVQEEPAYARAEHTIKRLRLNQRGLPRQRVRVALELQQRLEDFRENPSIEMKTRVLHVLSSEQPWPAIAWQIIDNPEGAYVPLVECWRQHRERI